MHILRKLFSERDDQNKSFLIKRLVWIKEGPSAPIVSEKDKGKEKPKDAAKDKLDSKDQVKEISELKLKGDGDKPIDIARKNPKNPATAVEFKKTLSEKLKDKPQLIDPLMEGLIQNIPDMKAESTDKPEIKFGKFSNWLKDKNVGGFNFDKGEWSFFDVKGDALKAPVVMDKKVKDYKDEAEAKDRMGKIEWDKCNSDLYAFNKDSTIKGLGDSLAGSIKLDTKLTGKEISDKLISFITKEYKSESGKNDQETLQKFITEVSKEPRNITGIQIEGGKFVFIDKVGKKTSNFEYTSINPYLSEQAKAKGEAGEKAAGEAAEKAKVVLDEKKGAFSATELSVQKLLTGNPKLEEKDVKGLEPTVDARYTDAFQKIMAYKGETLQVSIPFNDKPLDCKFYKAPDGRYILTYGKDANSYAYFKPAPGDKQELLSAQKFFADYLNAGTMLKDVQTANISDKKSFEDWGMKIDEGPAKVTKGGRQMQEYEINWPTSLLERDPHVFVEALPHGEIKVIVEKSGIGIKPASDKYEFVAGGFQDMARTLLRLKDFYIKTKTSTSTIGVETASTTDGYTVEAKDKTSDDKLSPVQQKEFNDRFFDNAKANIEKSTVKIGKVERVMRLPEVDASGKIDYKKQGGLELKLDWLTKFAGPNEAFVIGGTEGKYVLTLKSTNMPLGEAATVCDGLLKVIAAQREKLTTNGGQEKMNAEASDVLKGLGYGLAEGVLVKYIGETVPKQISLTRSEGGICYVDLKAGSDSLVKAADGKYLVSTKVGEKVAPTVEVKAPPKGSDLLVTREGGKKLTITPETEGKFKKVVDKISRSEDKIRLGDQLRISVAESQNPAEVDDMIKSILKRYAGVTDEAWNKISGDKNDAAIKIINEKSFKYNPETKNVVVDAKYKRTTAVADKLLGIATRISEFILKNEKMLSKKIGGKTFIEDYKFKMEAWIAANKETYKDKDNDFANAMRDTLITPQELRDSWIAKSKAEDAATKAKATDEGIDKDMASKIHLREFKDIKDKPFKNAVLVDAEKLFLNGDKARFDGKLAAMPDNKGLLADKPIGDKLYANLVVDGKPCTLLISSKDGKVNGYAMAAGFNTAPTMAIVNPDMSSADKIDKNIKDMASGLTITSPYKPVSMG